MAKRKQRLKRGEADAAVVGPKESLPEDLPRGIVWVRAAATALLGGLAVYAFYFPSDSVLVEQGDALWFCAAAILMATLTFASEPFLRLGCEPRASESTLRSLLGSHLLVDLFAWNLAAWMMLAALATSPPNNLRVATNEAWLWVAGAAVLTSARRLLSSKHHRADAIALVFGLVIAMSVHALHQNWISLPNDRQAYLNDPEAVMKAAGLRAPEWSSQQMIFANRLLDGGPTAQFALANSLAAVLPIGVLIGVTLLVRGWGRKESGRLISGALIALVLTSATALVFTRSRSATAACILGVAWLVIGLRIGKSLSARRLLVTSFVIGLALVAVTIGFLLLGDEEWMAAAPSSLLFRLRYWRSTLDLLGDHPLMGAGPGGFKAMYLRYRLPVSSESIADPHNFLFETLAAGGIVGGALLGILAWVCRRAKPEVERSDLPAERENTASPLTTAGPLNSEPPLLFVGAITTLAFIWLFALATGQFPDYEAHFFAVPVGIAAMCMVRGEILNLTGKEVRTFALAIIGTVLIHLCFAGGWTVPGVAIWLWLSVAICCHSRAIEMAHGNAGADTRKPMARRLSLIAVLAGAALLICIRVASLGPTQASRLAQLRAMDSDRRGFSARANEESRRAVTADPWAVEPALWRSQWLLGGLLRSGKENERVSWLEATGEVADRAGEDPRVIRALGEQSLHLYQRFGREDDLVEAGRLLNQALSINPSEVSLIAQLALVALEGGDREHALELARLAEKISLLDNNVVQALGLQHVHAVEKIGPSAAGIPTLRRVETEFDRRIPSWRPAAETP